MPDQYPTPEDTVALIGARVGRVPDLFEMPCNQPRCGRPATVYAIDPAPGGWGGRYCEPCARELRFTITDRLNGGPLPAIQDAPDRSAAAHVTRASMLDRGDSLTGSEDTGKADRR